MNQYTILGIETSCDEVGAAIYSTKHGLQANKLYSQTEEHKHFGGVIPEIASRLHIQKINGIIQEALDTAGMTLNDIDAIAVTSKPGLPGSLLIGTCFAKALAGALNKKIIAIDHLEGHAFSACIEHTIPFPALCITASGGHSSIYRLQDYGDWSVLGTTLDDAAGEAFDKIAKLLQLGYPGGPIIEQYAKAAGFKDYFNYPRNKLHDLMFSFSGLKTAVLYDLVKQGAYDLATKKLLTDSQELKHQVASSFLVCVGDIFAQKVTKALKDNPSYKALAFVGGVACNKYLQSRLTEVAHKHGIPFYVPSAQFCTDNAAMIAFVGHYKLQQGLISPLDFDIL